MDRDPLEGLAVFERGWLSSNNVLIAAVPGEPGAVLVDTGHVNHAEQTVALVRHALAGRPLARVVNTHLHSDHCGGNAALARAYGVPVQVPATQADAVRDWDDDRLTYRAAGQRIERFGADAALAPRDAFVAGGRTWQVLGAPGHDPDSLMMFDADHGVLLSADALWEHGFGVVFPELGGEPGFDDVEAVLDAIERLPVRVGVPGHGAPFADVPAALARSRSRLAAFRADPARHARHGAKVLVKYHVMEVRSQARAALLDWGEATPLLASAWRTGGDGPLRAWIGQRVDELLAAGALGLRDDGCVVDA